MLDWKGVAGAAAVAVLAVAGLARAEESSSSGAVPRFLPADRPLLLADDVTAPAPAPTPRAPFMALMDKAGIGKTLDDLHINMFGYIEGGYTFSFSNPPNATINGNVFNTQQARLKLDAIDFNIVRSVDAAMKEHRFDIGGAIEMMYGWDMAKIHSNGMGIYGGGGFSSSGQQQPENQFDPTQLYLTAALPVGNGVLLTAGKFITPLGYEVIAGPTNQLYSHSYLFGYAIPFTHTGITGTYVFNDQFTSMAGITRGWNQSTKDNNGAIDFLGSVVWTPTKTDTGYLNLSWGPQATGDCSNYWTVVDLIWKHTFNDKLSAAVNADYGDAPHALASGSSAQWYGVAGYGSYVLSDYLTFNARVEWYNDQDGFTIAGTNTQFYEATIGLKVTPMPSHDILKNLVIRPELRGDYASSKFFDAGTDHYQFQFAVDAYFTF